jgi:hypothetical protein
MRILEFRNSRGNSREFQIPKFSRILENSNSREFKILEFGIPMEGNSGIPIWNSEFSNSTGIPQEFCGLPRGMSRNDSTQQIRNPQKSGNPGNHWNLKESRLLPIEFFHSLSSTGSEITESDSHASRCSLRHSCHTRTPPAEKTINQGGLGIYTVFQFRMDEAEFRNSRKSREF